MSDSEMLRATIAQMIQYAEDANNALRVELEDDAIAAICNVLKVGRKALATGKEVGG